ncbi:MAG: DNA repair protein RecN [Oscillatoria sp. SIO1A7]|nr:DNA repair protein RecN [Oscillatoria sp. SIO1A7]
MLLSLRIENFALIDRLEIEFGSGLNVLTGETGAGKSIVLDALDATLGGKISGGIIRTGEQKATLEATFDLHPAVADWIRQQEIELLDGNLLVASREMVLSRGGGARSRSRLNGVLVNRQIMDQFRDRLVEITAQGQTVQLGQTARQRDWLDAFGGPKPIEQRQVVAEKYARSQHWKQVLENRRQSEQQRLQRLDFLEYQLKELGEVNLSDPEELQLLEAERQRLSHVVELQQQSYQVYQLLYQNDADGSAAADLLGRVESTLNDMVAYDNELQPVLEMVKEALAQVSEAGRQVSRYSSSLEADPERLEEVQSRIGELKQICRKYGPTLAEAIAHYQGIQEELEELTGASQSLESLEKNYLESQVELESACSVLTELRQAAAVELEARLLSELRPLAMEKAKFRVEIAPGEPNSTGANQIAFLFSANPGEPLQPLSKTASGGEMSRFLLALKACFSQVEAPGTLVFDEIDVGVSGRVAAAIAEKLYQLSKQQQVLFVTHQPIVAAMADRHFRVAKQIVEGWGASELQSPVRDRSSPIPELPDVRTVVRVAPLEESQRRQELAQMAGGQEAGVAIAWAESLLHQAVALRDRDR